MKRDDALSAAPIDRLRRVAPARPEAQTRHNRLAGDMARAAHVERRVAHTMQF